MAYKDRKTRKLFVETWKNRGYEKGETQQFWLSLLTNVLGYEHNDTVLFEHHTSTGGYIDVWIRQSDVMIEQKGIEIDLDKEEPRQGTLKTPLQQVQDYAASLPITEQPKYLITCNFETFRIYDRTKYGDAELKDNKFEFTLEDLIDHPEYLSCIVDPGNSRLRKEQEVSEQAGRLIGDLYDMLLKQYHDQDSEETKHSLNVLCVRIVFCLFCEDAGLFGEPDAFCNYLSKVDPSNIRIKLQHLFDNLDKPRSERDEYDEDIKVFPYVNGGLFKEKVIIPNFTQELKDFLIDKMALQVNWSNISPTIFGGIFESTLNPETRRKGGMHYTSPENIHKVIDPLFLNDLKAEFDAIRTNEELSVIQKRNRYKKFHEKLCSLVFFDPACGSGNFLTETYICLRRLEYAVLKEYKSKQVSLFDSAIEGEVQLRIKLDQFYGIEINDFAVAVAETALWISRLKANQEYLLLLDLDEKDFPLTDRANIICENALRFDWNDLVEPSRVSYILGNPPFLGHISRSEEQSNELRNVWERDDIGRLDYVTGWYKKASDYADGFNIDVAFVSTNSISMGEPVPVLFGYLFSHGWNIKFAHRTFYWESDSLEQAHVHVVIVALTKVKCPHYLFLYNHGKLVQEQKVGNINGYLLDAPNIFIEQRRDVLSPYLNPVTMGNMPRGTDLIVEPEDVETILNDHIASKYLRRFVMGRELIQNKERYCLWMEEADLQELMKSPILKYRLERIKKSRLESSAKSTRDMADTPHLFGQRAFIPRGTYLGIPKVFSENREYATCDLLNADVIPGDKVYVCDDPDGLQFAVISSKVFILWQKAIGGRLKSDCSFSNTVVWNNFPFPEITDRLRQRIISTGKNILDTRSLYPDKSLADLYDPDKMPEDLKAAHEANDRAVMDAYGFSYDMTEPEIVAELMKMYQVLTMEN
ncbi:MAG: methylase [Saccharofermentans sp.]|nr:methylase [Saccharofermentans sp.]